MGGVHADTYVGAPTRPPPPPASPLFCPSRPLQFNIGHLETVGGAQEALRQAGWDGVLLGGNYVAGGCAGWRSSHRCRRRRCRRRRRCCGRCGRCLRRGHCCCCSYTTPPTSGSSPSTPPLSAGVALGKCIEYGYTFAGQVAEQLKKTAAKA